MESLEPGTMFCPTCERVGQIARGRYTNRCRECWREYDRKRFAQPKVKAQRKAALERWRNDPKNKEKRRETAKARRRADPSIREKEIALNHKNKLRRLDLTPDDLSTAA
jgi:hypothetical protein